MSLDYHNLLRTAEELEKEASTNQVREQQHNIDRMRWLQSGETQELLLQLHKDFNAELERLLNMHMEMNEGELKCRLTFLMTTKNLMSYIKQNN